MPQNTAYQATLEYLYSTLPAFQRQGAPALKPSLKNTEDLCFELGFPQWKFKSVHIAGTNGKGSVSSMLFSILRAAGYRTGLYTSPHLLDFTERIRVNESNVPHEEVVAFVEKWKPVINYIHPS
ncbi:MAG: bifunctional folylpolyglutamate synthase/dihydrofolate synthase, partial [Bacteroidota bacterium]